jgi:hypothetical protein
MDKRSPRVRRSTIIRPKTGLAYQELVEGSGGVFLHLETGQYHGVNEVGALVWSLVGEGTRFGDLVDAVRQQVEDPPADLSDDIAAFLADLEAREFVSLEDGGGNGPP